MHELTAAIQTVHAKLSGLTLDFLGPAPVPAHVNGISVVYTVLSAPDTLSAGGKIVCERPLIQIMVSALAPTLEQVFHGTPLYKYGENMHNLLHNKAATTSEGVTFVIQRERSVYLPVQETGGQLRLQFGGWYRFVTSDGS